MAEAQKRENGKAEKGIPVPINLNYPADLQGRFANHLVVQYDDGAFHISFFEVQPPFMLGSLEERLKKAEELKDAGLQATCVARVIIAERRMSEFVRVLNEHQEKHIGKNKGTA